MLGYFAEGIQAVNSTMEVTNLELERTAASPVRLAAPCAAALESEVGQLIR